MKKSLFILFLILSVNATLGQTSAADEFLMPEERIYLHQNTTLLMSGEYLHYKLYCLNSETHASSDLSKVAYVELVGQDGKAVFSHKVRLENGSGQGDFFVPTTVPSGNYKLVAFTQWMRNGEVDDFYQNDIVVINPFQNNQSGLMRSAADSIRTPVKAAGSGMNSSSPTTAEGVMLQISPQSAGNREHVNLTMSKVPSEWYGNYSLSIRKIVDKLPVPKRETAASFVESVKGDTEAIKVSGVNALALPELRGELLTGKVINKETGQVVPNRKVGLSIPGTNYLFKISSTRENGAFFFNVDESYTNEQALIQVIGEDRDSFRIELDEFQSPDYSKLTFSDFTLDESEECYP